MPIDTSANSNVLLTGSQISQLSSLEVQTSSGSSVAFGSLINPSTGNHSKTLVVALRHFWCGLCKAYLTQLCEQIPESVAKEHGMNIVVLGCGSWEPIKDYAATTNCPYPIYADPTKKVYQTLGTTSTMAHTPSGQPRKSYLKESMFTQAMGSLKVALTNVGSVNKVGSFKQNGGEFIFESGPINIFAHRMQNTEDHTEIAEIIDMLSV
ncbi:Uncharacterized conserved protein [Phaffia rhodozyma]|uniref:Uncharacterized conserved protein n=1 Tax=Phaffia rhodozyma TaxID=264483 RepID=A0A0F7SMM5_PHARH|nr:Uncharacterized conserved protein [Phaffia rhodozyma]